MNANERRLQPLTLIGRPGEAALSSRRQIRGTHIKHYTIRAIVDIPQRAGSCLLRPSRGRIAVRMGTPSSRYLG